MPLLLDFTNSKDSCKDGSHSSIKPQRDLLVAVTLTSTLFVESSLAEGEEYRASTRVRSSGQFGHLHMKVELCSLFPLVPLSDLSRGHQRGVIMF